MDGAELVLESVDAGKGEPEKFMIKSQLQVSRRNVQFSAYSKWESYIGYCCVWSYCMCSCISQASARAALNIQQELFKYDYARQMEGTRQPLNGYSHQCFGIDGETPHCVNLTLNPHVSTCWNCFMCTSILKSLKSVCPSDVHSKWMDW